MGMLQQLMANTQKQAGKYASAGRGSSGDVVAKENRAAYRKMMEAAVKEGNQQQVAALSKNAPPGVDLSFYTTLAGLPSPEQEAQRDFNKTITQFMSNILGGKHQQTQPDAPPVAPLLATQPLSIAPATPPTPTQPAQPSTKPADIFTPDFLLRTAIKKFSGIDVGGHYFDAPQWFDAYGRRVKNGVPVSQAVSDTAIEFGFVPSGASNLKDLSEPERKAIFEREFATALNDPTLSSIVEKIVPEGSNVQKAKAGLILSAFAEQGLYIPEHYQPFLDRFRGLDDPEFVSDNLKTWVYQTTGKRPSEIEPADIAKARTEMQNDAVVQAARVTSGQTTARIEAEFEKELLKPVSAEDRAKYGIGTQFTTYQELADSGKRFPIESDRKLYTELYTMRDSMNTFGELLFGSKKDPASGIFTGIGTNIGARSAAKGRLLYEKAKGSLRGRNLEMYDDLLASFARRLLTLAGESGGRFTDVDVAQISRSAPDVGAGITGLPDSEAVARAKHERFMVELGKRLGQLQDTTIIKPTGQPPPPTLIDQYEVGKIYPDAEGRKAKYLGEGKWEIQK